jgi:hypothetical protein
MTEITATFTKLRNGDWGVRVARADGYMPKAGEYVAVTKRDGSKTMKAIGRVVWSNDEVALCTI